MTVTLSDRLAAVAACVPRGSRLADIGSDHALLPVWLAEQGIIKSAVAGELNRGPWEAARRQVEASGWSRIIDVRQGDGLSVFSPGEVDTVVIAGMGGALIKRILTEGADRLAGVNRLVLQPNVAEDQVREWLSDRGWYLDHEQVVEEEGRFYVVLSAVPESSSRRSAELYAPLALDGGVVVGRELLLRLGPHLVRRPSAVFCRKWEREIEKMSRIVDNLRRSETEEAAAKRAELEKQIRQIGEVLRCLSTDIP